MCLHNQNEVNLGQMQKHFTYISWKTNKTAFLFNNVKIVAAKNNQ